ncbi:MAG: hypothetical protein J7M38_01240, partial [Armatimonadetes bacterium]|nr:hypothetical protein [Armatimonadota bacterium]
MNKTKWTTVKVPVEIRNKIKTLSQKTGKAYWKTLLNALSLYESQLKKPKLKEELPTIDKVSWYIVKLSSSMGIFKANPSQQNYERFLRTIEQVEKRLEIDLSLLKRVARDYYQNDLEDLRVEL